MRRLHLFEFTDLSWYPKTLRRLQTDYLQFVAARGSGPRNLVPLLRKALQQAGAVQIVDLCSGGTGPWVRLREQLEQAGMPVRITLTDEYPDPEAVLRWSRTARPGIEYLAEPVDALNVPRHLDGMRTLFEGFHHFDPKQARSILQQAVDAQVAIGVFEATLQRPFGPLLLPLMPLLTLLGYLFSTPFIRPRTFSRFLWTYLVPVVPLATCWDGIISLLRVYSLQDLKQMTDSLERQGYTWEARLVSIGAPLFEYVSLIGFPTQPRPSLVGPEG